MTGESSTLPGWLHTGTSWMTPLAFYHQKCGFWNSCLVTDMFIYAASTVELPAQYL